MSFTGKLSLTILILISSAAPSLAIEPSEINCNDDDTFCAASCALSDVPSSTRLNLVEFGHIGCDGNLAVSSMLDYRLRPEALNTELYWHHFSVEGYTGSYTLTFEGWLGVVSHMTMTCTDNGAGQNPYGIVIHGDGVFSDHSVDFGTRNAFFVEDSIFNGCSYMVYLSPSAGFGCLRCRSRHPLQSGR